MTPNNAGCPLSVFQAAIADGIHESIGECWRDFAHWEHARQFADDPSHPAKVAIEWILAWEELRAGLDEFAGAAKQECIEAVDRVGEAFAKLDHSAELVQAAERWRQTRRQELQSVQ